MVQRLASKFFYNIRETVPIESNEAGSLTYVTSMTMPGLRNASFCNLVLKKNGFLKPLWHPNASKVGYCAQGKCLVTLRTPDRVENFTVEGGEMFFIPMGFPHEILNQGEEECRIQFALNHETPETILFAQAIYSLSEPVIRATFNASINLSPSKNGSAIVTYSGAKKTASPTSSYKFNLGRSKKIILTKGGYLQSGLKTNLPLLNGLGILGFGLNVGGVVEPHWHTNAGELIYIAKGKTRITLLSPDNNVEVLEVSGGEGAFAPPSHFHNIENIGSDEVEVIAFFSHAEPDFIGIGEVLGAFTNDELGAIFNVPPTTFDNLKKPQGPLAIVPE